MLKKTELRQNEIFRGLNRENMDELVQWMDLVELGRNKMIFREGQKPNGLYLLSEGEVAVIKRTPKGRIRIAVLESPSFFGEISLLIDKTRSTSIRTLTPCRLGFLHKDIFLRMIEKRNTTALLITANLGKLLSQRLANANEQMEVLTERERALEQGRRYRETHV